MTPPNERTSPRALHYAEPRHSSLSQRILRYALLGPVAGAIIGAIDTATALCFWLFHGQPDFYFRGWSGVRMTLPALTVGGAMAGVAFAVMLYLTERLLRRTAPMRLLLIAMAAVAVVTFLIVDCLRFRDMELWGGFWPETWVAVASYFCALLLAHRRPVHRHAP